MKKQFITLIAFILNRLDFISEKDYNNFKFNLKLFSILIIVLSIIPFISAVGTMINCSADPSIVACYHFNNDSTIGERYNNINDTIVDSSIYSLNGTSRKPLFKNNNSYINDGYFSFNGTGDNINYSYNSHINQSFSQFTISVWINPNNTQFYSTGRIVEKSYHFMLYIINSSKSVGVDTTTLSDSSINSLSAINTNNWSLVTFTYNGSLKSLYINGVLDKSENALGSINSSKDFKLTLGSNSSFPNFFYNGYLDEVMIYNKSLSSGEVLSLYYNYQDCIIPTNNFKIYSNNNIRFCEGNYSVNSSVGLSSAIDLIGNNIALDCQNSRLFGNSTSIGLRSDGNYNNILIENCIINNYRYGIRFSNGGNKIINNVTINNSLYDGIIFSYQNSSNIYNSTLYNNGINGIYLLNSNSNEIINNNVFDNIFNSIHLDYSNLNYVYNNNFQNIYSKSHHGLNVTNSNFNNVSFNTFLNSTKESIYLLYDNSSSINNNYINNIWGIFNRRSNNTQFYNNNIIGNKTPYTHNILIEGGYNQRIFNNNVSFTQYTFWIVSTNLSIFNNTIKNSDIGTVIKDSFNITFKDNTIINTTLNLDYYNLGLKVVNSFSTNIINNNFTEQASGGIFLQRSNDTYINNNKFNFIRFSDRNYYSASDSQIPPCSIISSPIYKGWFGGSFSQSTEDTIINTSYYINNNLTISNNQFYNAQCFLWSDGTNIINHDLSNYKYFIYQYPVYLMPKSEVYINYSVGNLSYYRSDYYDNQFVFKYQNIQFADIILNKYYSYFFSINYQNLSLFNITDSIIYDSTNNTLVRSSHVNQQFNITINPNKEVWVYNESAFITDYDLTNALIFNSTYNVYNITLHNGKFNYSLFMNPRENITYLFNDYRLTENNSLNNEPFNITGSSTNNAYKMWSISSLINEDIKIRVNLSFYNCSQLKTVIIQPKDKTPYTTRDYSCSGNRLYINNVNMSYSTTSDEIYAFFGFGGETHVFNDIVLSGSLQNYLLYISYNSSEFNMIKGEIVYNGTIHNATMSFLGEIGTFDTTFNVPIVSSNTIYNFYWNITLQNTTSTYYYISDIQNQTVVVDFLSICNAAYNVSYINFTTRDMFTENLVNTTFKATFWYNNQNYSYSDQVEDNYTYSFCFIPTDRNYEVDAIIEYDASGYAPNYYYLDNANLTNQTSNINLYLLNNSFATFTKLKVYDESHKNLQDVIISIQAYDTGTNTYKTVSMAKTDDLGEDISYLNWYDTFYKFILTKDGEVLHITSPTKVTETPKNFQVFLNTFFEYDKFDNIVYTLSYNNETKNFVLTYVLPSGKVTEACLRVVKRTLKNDTTICEVCESSQSATLYCNIGAYGNGTYIGMFYAKGSLGVIDVLMQTLGYSNTIFDLLGNRDGSILAFLFAGIVLTMFMITPVLAIVGIILGVLGAMVMGFQPMNYAEFLGVTIVGVIIIWLIKR